MKLNTLATLGALAILTAVASADITGIYSGGMVVLSAQGKLLPVPDEQAKAMKVSFELKADKTYTGTQTTPQGKSIVTGTYTVKKDVLEFTPKMRDGKPATGAGATVRKYVISKDQKSLSFDLTDQLKGQLNGAPEGTKIQIVVKKSS